MCGIVGKIYFDGNNASGHDILVMNESVKHRGPNDGGVYISPDQKVGLGHRRLSIIDLSPLGHQPMNYLERYWIVFNGEIYNYQEKRVMLEKEGYIFKSHSDTEVILALYDKFGKDCLSHLRGMFAFAIYDEKEKTIFCARDRIGKKPFKYYLDDSVFIFASELKAILTQKEYIKEPDYVAIHHYLTLQYCPTPMTGFKDIKKLEPAHYLFIDLRTKKIEKTRYWKLDYSKKLNLTEEEWKKKILNKLEESVSLRMVSDVPLGAFLSGGIDSSAIVGLMSKLSKSPVKTFSIGFKEEKYNELPYAKIIADKFKTDHTEFVVEPDAINILPELIRHYEEPYADSSALPTYYVSKMTRDHVTVALNGDGGDENFAGYPWYSVNKFAAIYEKFLPLHKIFIEPLLKLAAKFHKSFFMERVLIFSEIIKQPYDYRYVEFVAYFTNRLKKELYSDFFTNITKGQDTYEIIRNKFKEVLNCDKTDQALYVDANSYLPDDLLVKVDIDTMAVSLEGRSPFLDHEFMEMAAQIPFNLKLKRLNNKKWILKKSLEGLIPNEVMYRKKRGFGVPLDRWFRKELNGYAKSVLLSEKALGRNLFKESYLRKIFSDHESGKTNRARHIWALLTLELWFREFFDSE